MSSSQRPEERALGDVLAPENATPASVGVSAEPPGFLKRLFSVPKNVRRTAAVGDVVVPVIGARDGWGGIRQARLLPLVLTHGVHCLWGFAGLCNDVFFCAEKRRQQDLYTHL